MHEEEGGTDLGVEVERSSVFRRGRAGVARRADGGFTSSGKVAVIRIFRVFTSPRACGCGKGGNASWMRGRDRGTDGMGTKRKKSKADVRQDNCTERFRQRVRLVEK